MKRSLLTNLDATSRLILDVASSSPSSWNGPIGPEQFGLAHHHGLLGLLATSSIGELREPAIGPYARLAGRQTVMMSHLRRLMERLDQASIPATVLKGPDLTTRVYRDSRHRTFTDVDILVPESTLSKTMDVLASDEAISSLPPKRPKADKRTIPVMDDSGLYFMVDLHWDLFSYSQLRGASDGATDWAWQNSQSVESSDVGPTYRLPEEAYVAFLSTHALLDHRFRLILFRDIAEMCHSGIDWESLLRFASEWNLRVFTYLALAMAKELAGAEVPEDFLSEIRRGSFSLRSTEVLMSKTDLVRFDGHRPHLLNLAMVLLHDQPTHRLRLLAHAPPAAPTWMRRFGRPPRRTIPMARRKGDRARVMIIVSSDQRRGAEVFAENLTGGLRGFGWDAQLLALAGQGGGARVSADLVLSDKPSDSLGRLNVGVLRSLRRQVRTWRPDVVLANGGSTLRYASAALAGMRGRPCLVYSSIGEPKYWIRGPVHRLVQKMLHKRADQVLAVSGATRDQLVDYVGVPAERVRVAYIGVPDELTGIDRVRDDGSLHVLFLGSLSPEKNPAAALDVFERVGQPDRFKLRFVGGGPLESELRQLSGSMLDMGAVEFAGSVRDVAPHLEWADVLLLPSITEGLPGAVLEAGAAGVPTVAFDVGGTAEAIINNETGLLVSAGDVESLADELRSLQADAELLSRLGTGARDLVVDRFLLGDTINRYIDLLDSAMTPTRRRSRPTRPG